MRRRITQRQTNIAMLATKIREHCARQLNGELESPREFLKGLHDLAWQVQKELGIKRIRPLTKTWGMSVITPDSSRSLRSTSPSKDGTVKLTSNAPDDFPASEANPNGENVVEYCNSHNVTLKKGTWWMIRSDVNSEGAQRFGSPNGLPHLHGKRILTNGIDCLIELDNGQCEWVLLDNWVLDPAPRGRQVKRTVIDDDEITRLLAALD